MFNLNSFFNRKAIKKDIEHIKNDKNIKKPFVYSEYKNKINFEANITLIAIAIKKGIITSRKKT